jgi:acetoin utilization protein AcuB
MAGPQHFVRDIMTAELVTIGMDATMAEVDRIFRERRFHHLVVLDRGQPVGVLSDRDLLKAISPFAGMPMSERRQDADTLRRRVHQIMTRRLVSITPEATVLEAARLFLSQRVSCLPVIHAAGALVGILTTRDMVRWVVHCETAQQ